MVSKSKSDKKRRGRKKSTEISVTSKKQISSLTARFKIITPVLTYRDLQQALTKKMGFAFSLGTIYNLARGKEPQDLELRRALKLPNVCPACKRKLPAPRITPAPLPDYMAWWRKQPKAKRDEIIRAAHRMSETW